MSIEPTTGNGRRVVIACRVMEPELKQVVSEGGEEFHQVAERHLQRPGDVGPKAGGSEK